MQIEGNIVGVKSRPYRVEISPRMVMNFAAGIPDPNTLHFDDERPEGIVAPAILPVALSWHMTADYERFWEEGLDAELRTRIVHYSEVLTLHRPIEPGDAIEVVGEVVAVLPHRAGTHFIARYTGTDASGESVFTEHAGAMLRGVTCVGSGKSAEGVPLVGRVEDSVEPLLEIPDAVDALAAHRYDAGADILNPIHTSPAFAHAVGLPAPILHGTCTLGRAIREVINRHADGDSRRVREIACNFTGMVLMDTTIQIRVLRVEDDSGGGQNVYFNVRNGNGDQAIRNGRVTLGPA